MAIAAQVLYRNLVEGAVDAALEQAESVLNRVCVRAHPCRRSGCDGWSVPAPEAPLAD